MRRTHRVLAVMEKIPRAFPQGLKPIACTRLMSELKLRPPERLSLSGATCKAES
jgi:hypothetical protein